MVDPIESSEFSISHRPMQLDRTSIVRIRASSQGDVERSLTQNVIACHRDRQAQPTKGLHLPLVTLQCELDGPTNNDFRVLAELTSWTGNHGDGQRLDQLPRRSPLSGQSVEDTLGMSRP